MVNAAGQQTPLLQTVAAPQSLWIGNAKVDWQLGAKSNFIASVDTYNNHSTNAGVGGVSLAETGYGVSRYDTNVHLTDVTTISPKIMHEGRVGIEIDGFSNTPNSTAPQVQVAGAFTSGGGSQGNSHERETWVSIIDDAIIQTANHLIKVGIQPEFLLIAQHFPTNSFFTPQTTGVNAGDTQGLWQVFGNATLNLPGRLIYSANYNGQGLGVYNVTTGFDNNGDGDFTDRHQYARVGTPLCSVNPNASPCGYATPWGELFTSGGVGSLPRNKGYMPWTMYLDGNLQRSFSLTHNAKAEHQQTLSINLRSSNLQIHRNVTAVGGVLGSPLFGQAYAADNGRRVEAGLRYAF